MPNGFHGPKDEWQRLEAPYLRIDPILAEFAQRHGFELYKNYRGADRSIRFNDALSRTIWVHATDTYGTEGKYQVAIGAYQDREDRYIKSARLRELVAKEELDRLLERATAIVLTWSEMDLEIPLPPRERGETEIID
jgi:hypothetical protein